MAKHNGIAYGFLSKEQVDEVVKIVSDHFGLITDGTIDTVNKDLIIRKRLTEYNKQVGGI